MKVDYASASRQKCQQRIFTSLHQRDREPSLVEPTKKQMPCWILRLVLAESEDQLMLAFALFFLSFFFLHILVLLFLKAEATRLHWLLSQGRRGLRNNQKLQRGFAAPFLSWASVCHLLRIVPLLFSPNPRRIWSFQCISEWPMQMSKDIRISFIDI